MSTIQETSKIFDIPSSTLRYYESIGLLEPVPKNKSGHRVYGEDEFRRLTFLKTLLKAGIPLKKIKKYIDLFHQGIETVPERKQILIDQLDILYKEVNDLKSVIKELEDVVKNYDDTLLKRELKNREDPNYG